MRSIVLSGYIARRLLAAIGISFLVIFTLIVLIDLVTLIQDASGSRRATPLAIGLLALMRGPLIAEQVFPFIILFAAIGAFVSLSRKMELVVARASGVSIWQILAPAVLTAAFVGLAVMAVFNPASTAMREASGRMEAALFDKTARTADRWIRQQSVDGQSILRAANSADRGQTLIGVTAFVFSREGVFQERVDAASAQLHEGYWEMRDARVQRPGVTPVTHSSYLLPTSLTPNQVTETIARPESISFWELPDVIVLGERTGLRTEKFRLQYQSLIARPALYATMVLIAACVSLGFSRFGSVWKAILGGVVAGFMLYVGGEMAGDLGAAGFITPVVAAWAPPIVGVLLSVTVLLHQEDG